MPVSENHSASKQKSKIKRTMGFASYWCNDLLKAFCPFQRPRKWYFANKLHNAVFAKWRVHWDEMLNNKYLNSAIKTRSWYQTDLKNF